MRKPFYVIVSMIVILSIITISCDTKVQETEEPEKIENTLQSVSYLQDTVGYDPQVLLEEFIKFNEAIDEIGYPDAGYKIWIIKEDTADIRFMVEGFWPNQEIYDEIHNHQLYKEAWENDDFNWDGLIRLEYHRFTKIK